MDADYSDIMQARRQIDPESEIGAALVELLDVFRLCHVELFRLEKWRDCPQK